MAGDWQGKELRTQASQMLPQEVTCFIPKMGTSKMGVSLSPKKRWLFFVGHHLENPQKGHFMDLKFITACRKSQEKLKEEMFCPYCE